MSSNWSNKKSAGPVAPLIGLLFLFWKRSSRNKLARQNIYEDVHLVFWTSQLRTGVEEVCSRRISVTFLERVFVGDGFLFLKPGLQTHIIGIRSIKIIPRQPRNLSVSF